MAKGGRDRVAYRAHAEEDGLEALFGIDLDDEAEPKKPKEAKAAATLKTRRSNKRNK